jgi:hypothetical protein
MDFKTIKALRLENSLTSLKILDEGLEQIDEVSNYDQVVTYYRHLGLDPYKLRGVIGAKLRDKIKNSPAFKAWLQLKNRLEHTEQDATKSLVETIKDAKKESSGKRAKVTFYGYPDKNAKLSNSEKEIANTPNNYLNQN